MKNEKKTTKSEEKSKENYNFWKYKGEQSD
jgi:hypothetical protein